MFIFIFYKLFKNEHKKSGTAVCPSYVSLLNICAKKWISQFCGPADYSIVKETIFYTEKNTFQHDFAVPQIIP